jgi:hypothetical protein
VTHTRGRGGRPLGENAGEKFFENNSAFLTLSRGPKTTTALQAAAPNGAQRDRAITAELPESKSNRSKQSRAHARANALQSIDRVKEQYLM